MQPRPQRQMVRKRPDATRLDALAPLSPRFGGGGYTRANCQLEGRDRKSTRLNSSHGSSSYAVFGLKQKTVHEERHRPARAVLQVFRQNGPWRRSRCRPRRLVFFFNDTPTTESYTLSLHDALPISSGAFQIHVKSFEPHGATRNAKWQASN